MKRGLSSFGLVLIVAGVALLAYVGFSYLHQTTTSSAGWNGNLKKQGQQIAQQLASQQSVSIPSRLGSKKHVSPGAEAAISIAIPKIDVHAPVVQTPPVNGVWDVADWAVGHLTTTPDPGAAGNAAYAGHDDIKGEVFKRLGELRPGDRILLRTRHALYTYVVTNQEIVDPSNVSVLDPTRQSTVTLVSCTPYWVDTQRLIVQAVLKSARAA
jgi:sortase A